MPNTTWLSICMTVKDRSRATVSRRSLMLLPNCLASLVTALNDVVGRIEVDVIIADWQSTDWPLHEWVHQHLAPTCLRIVPVDGSFSRGRGLNIAAKHAVYDKLFFVDADMLVSADALNQGLRALEQGHACFPECSGYADQAHTRAKPMPLGLGNCFVMRHVWESAGRWPEWTQWGGEDHWFYNEVADLVPVERPSVPSFRHQWHPDSWRDRHMLTKIGGGCFPQNA